MRTCRFSNQQHYIAAGKTRTETRTTAIISGMYNVQFCPFSDVDGELEVICKLSRQWIKSWRNPFGTASWIHLILAGCHPFEDGNGRMARLIASIPLIKNGYPPISLAMARRTDYYAAINKAHKGDHSAFVQGMLLGMQETISSVRSLLSTVS
ncbi:fido domain-containing protein [Crucibulum laeve]|uniref:Fido domain-containing protein n=1 Tax=Crucibulum laeve TaxID=68775 RepID=A0A5C3LGT8_9AGAR|nr:fido domain-containing protein [Crucibulum laeve]